jgi:hypothetical protein
MSPNPWLTVMPIMITVLIASIGWLLARLHTLNQLVDTQRETISELRRQVDRLEITAELTDKLLTQLPKPRASGGTR